MRRKVAWIVAGLFIAGTISASAGPDPVTVTPNPVRQNKKLTVKATDCESGDGWTAYVRIEIQNAEGEEVYFSYREADDDGSTKKKIKMKKAKYPKGTYMVLVDCIHEFDKGGEGTWYETDHEITVKKPKKKS